MTDGMMGAYSTFVYSYAVEKPLSLGHKVAGYLPSLFWGFITLGQLVSIPISSKVNPATMVFINVVGVVVTSLVLLAFPYNVIFLFVGTAILGLFLSSTFPSLLAYTEDILQYKGCATTVLVTGAGVGEMSLQMLVGWDAPWTLISSYPGQTTWNGKLGVLPEVKLGEGDRRRHPAS
ncbi:major facilitator superfamily domain containing 4A [Rhinolophus ferrumequinum]|uniref:Major facilitator superfamily domain containing 4A n=1 Tax=Rhinolophus ferrumequinum TaxID=59479 RepID=A0A7J7SXU4_RHIFE|nr:major facilitator superfamily domain containing 4A [Rhinolophus ferrumequinum]